MGNIGQYIKELRESRGYSQRNLASLSGISNVTISRIESGFSKPSPDTLKKIANILKVTYDELMETAGYISRKKIVPSNIKLIREEKQMTYAQLVEDIKRVTGEEIPPSALESIEKGKDEDPLPKYIHAIAKYEGVNPDFFFRENTPEHLEYAVKHDPYRESRAKDAGPLTHIKDAKLKKWIGNPASVGYLTLAKKISDLGVDPGFVYSQFAAKAARKKRSKKQEN